MRCDKSVEGPTRLLSHALSLLLGAQVAWAAEPAPASSGPALTDDPVLVALVKEARTPPSAPA